MAKNARIDNDHKAIQLWSIKFLNHLTNANIDQIHPTDRN